MEPRHDDPASQGKNSVLVAARADNFCVVARRAGIALPLFVLTNCVGQRVGLRLLTVCPPSVDSTQASDGGPWPMVRNFWLGCAAGAFAVLGGAPAAPRL
jgi:hypothetical protein